jgi:hypothetical protein
MHSTSSRPRSASVLALVVAGLTFAGTTTAGAADRGATPYSAKQRLVVRGDATVVDRPCEAGVCLELAGGRFRGTPTGIGDYTGTIKLRVAETFENGEGGVCAPIDGRIVLGAGSPDRLVLAVSGDSCQDGTGPVTAASFTGLARFKVRYGTGRYAGAAGSGLAGFAEDATDHDRMTLIGRITR